MAGIRFRLGIGPDLTMHQPLERILMYHGIDAVSSTEYNTRFISQSAFEKQTRFFAENANCISLDSFFEGNFDKDKMNLALTFDDGYQNNLTRALPILEKYNLPASFFITAIRST